jgi:hypothetical protein
MAEAAAAPPRGKKRPSDGDHGADGAAPAADDACIAEALRVFDTTTKSHLLRVAEYVRTSRRVGDVLQGDARTFVLRMVARHPDKAPRAHLIRACRIVRDGKYNTVQLELTDGTTDLLSLRKCLAARTTYDREALLKALRTEVAGQIRAFREGASGAGATVARTCVLCGGVGEHVDHTTDFIALADTFLAVELGKRRGEPPPAVHQAPHPLLSQEQTWRLRDAATCSRWQAYHAQRAALQWLCAPCNLRKRKAAKSALRFL